MALALPYLALRPDADDPDLESTLSRLCALVEAADIPVDRLAFIEALAALPKPAGKLDDERVRELALGLACADGDRAALRRFENDYLAHVPRLIGSMKLADADVDDVVQEVRRKLLVAEPGERPKIAGYAGRGSLRGLLKVTATRTALSMLRKSGRESPADDAMDAVVGEADPELNFLKARYRTAFREAFETAVEQLEPRQRNLLRLHFLRKVTLEDLASMYGVHRATVVRHLARARDDIDRATQRALRTQLEVSPRELESVMDLIRSRFDVSVERLLKTQAGG
ncbi:MAG: sigma-70 family RNA polymerase sigma factor [Sandaracinaceae bacterium]